MKIYARSQKMKNKIEEMTKFILRHLKLNTRTLRNLKIKQSAYPHTKWGGYAYDYKIVIYTRSCYYSLAGTLFHFKHPDLLDTRRFKILYGDEFLFSVLAHELRHIWQYEFYKRPYVKYRGRFPKKPKYTNEDWKDKEYDCMLFEEKMLKKWRKHLTNSK